MTLADGKAFEVAWGGDASPGKVYAKRADVATLYEVGSYRKTSIFNKPEDLREAPAPAAAPGEMAAPAGLVSPAMPAPSATP